MIFYKSLDSLHERFQQQRPPKEEMETLRINRNEQVKMILSTSQYNSFMQVEKQLGPPKHKHGHMPPSSSNL
jgi:hypothetical protein